MKLSDFTDVVMSGLKINEVPKIGIADYANGVLTLNLTAQHQSPDIFYHTVTANTTIQMNFATTNKMFLLVLTNAGNYTLTWPSNVKWPGGVIPTFTTNGIDLIHISKLNVPNGANTNMIVASVIKNAASV